MRTPKKTILIWLVFYLQITIFSAEAHEIDGWEYECFAGECILSRQNLNSTYQYCNGNTLMMIHRSYNASFIVIELLGVDDIDDLDEVVIKFHSYSPDGVAKDPEHIVEPSYSAYVGKGYRLAYKIDNNLNYLIHNASLISVGMKRKDRYSVCGNYPLDGLFMHYYKMIQG